MADECTIHPERDGERLQLRLSGVFDRAAAWWLRERLDCEAAEEVVLDFGLVRDFSDLGVAVLANGLAGSGRRLLLRGLGPHQLRIFRHCGVPVEQLDGRDTSAVEPSPGA